MEGMFTSILRKRGDKLVHVIDSDNIRYKAFINSLAESQQVEIFLDANKDDGTLAQLAKLHKCIRELAKEMGETFEDTKLMIKHKAGLCVKKKVNGEDFMVCKSFGDCSKEDLGLALQAVIQVGDFVGINFR